jgi:hypothetical protein
MPIVKNLARFFKHSPTGNLGAIVDAMDDSFNKVRTSIVELDTEYLIFNSTGDWLDIWGSSFNVSRFLDEPDALYRARILSTATRPRNTIPAIVSAVKTFVGNEETIVVYEPFTNMRKFNISTFNGKDKFPDGSYYRPSVIDIQTSGNITQALRNAIEKIKAAGVKVYFTSTGEVSGPPVDMSTDVEPKAEYVFVIQLLCISATVDSETPVNIGMSYNTEIIDDLIFSETITQIEMSAFIYKTITAGSLFIINDVADVTVADASIMADDTQDSVEVIDIS